LRDSAKNEFLVTGIDASVTFHLPKPEVVRVRMNTF
jgi:hypothetical protein